MARPRFRLFFPWFDTRAVPVLVGIVGALYLLEEVFALRERTQDKKERSMINTAVAATGFSVVRLALLPLMVWLGALGERRRFGLVQWLDLPPRVQWTAGFLLLDYTNYVWHVLMHRVPLLYRFHNVHHTDLDLDVTTGFRFHLGEQVASIFFRGGAVALIGAPAQLVLVYEAIFEGCTAFHHSNVRLPGAVERGLATFLITPRAHGIHHSIVREEFDSNYGIIFNFWDRLHRTRKCDIAREEITIGVPGWRDPVELTVPRLHTMPFEEQRPWVLQE